MRYLLVLLAVLLFGCPSEPAPFAVAGDVRIAEVVSSNLGGGPGGGRDERGEWDDWIELENLRDHDIDLQGVQVSDKLDAPGRYRIPEGEPVLIPAKGRRMLFADGETYQGPTHLPFLLSKKGEAVVLSTRDGQLLDSVEVPALETGESYARIGDGFVACPTPTPNTANDCVVVPLPPTTYDPYVWPDPWPPVTDAPVIISEVSRTFIELENHGPAIDLALLELSYGTVEAPRRLPETTLETTIPLSGRLETNARLSIDVALPASAVVVLRASDRFLDRVAYEALADAVLVRRSGVDLFVACALESATPGAANAGCVAPPPRATRPSFLRAIRSDADLTLLAEHDEERTSDARSVKFVIDRFNGNTVYFMDSTKFPLHFDWVWEVLDKKAPFDLCDPAERAQHDAEWVRFSQRNYFSTTNRQFYLGTLVHYADSDLYTIEFASGDLITSEQIRDAFFLVAEQILEPKRLFVRPTTASFEARMTSLEGLLPIVPAGTPFAGTRFFSLNPGVAYGVLEVVEDIEEAALSFQSIPIFTRIPNDVPLVGGTITEEPQTPLAHVNVLAQNRGTPNMALLDASTDPRVAPFLGKLVRLDVTRADFSLRVASSTEAEAFWEERFGSRPPFYPERDLSVRDLVDLDGASFDDIAKIGAKASQYAELSKLDYRQYAGSCADADRLPVPTPAFAIPFARFVEHLEAHGIDADIAALLADEDVLANPAERRAALEAIREKIADAPVDPTFLATLESKLAEVFGPQRVRFRSSTNVEDLVGFNGAGLYSSKSAQANSRARPVADALREVWASTYAFRAFEERRLFNVDETKVAMGVLVHRGFPGEDANGVAITKNVIDPSRVGYYINAQHGEVSIVNPETGFAPEQLLYKPFAPPEVTVLARSNLTRGAPVMSEQEVFTLACTLKAAHARFRAHYAEVIPAAEFALDVEFKIDGPSRRVMLKQARPWIGKAVVESTCE